MQGRGTGGGGRGSSRTGVRGGSIRKIRGAPWTVWGRGREKVTSAVGSHRESADGKEIARDGGIVDGNCRGSPLRGARQGTSIIHHWKGKI